MEIFSKNYTFDWRPKYPFLVTATRYTLPTSDSNSSPQPRSPPSFASEGFTAICAHGTGFHKEQWEPTICHLFGLQDHSVPLREVWTVDCPNHGQSYILNEKAIAEGGYRSIFPWDEYTKALYWFLTQNTEFDFSSRRLIAIGHSMGAVCLTLTQTYPHGPRFEQFVLCEPMLVPPDLPVEHPLLSNASKFLTSTEKRQDIWPSSHHLRASLESKRGFQAWDRQVFDLYLKFGFRELPTLVYPNKQGVTLACPKSQEAACYRDLTAARRVFQFLPVVCAQVPVHVIWGAIDDSVATEVKRRATDPTTGRKMASVQRIEGVGHLIVQAAPSQLAAAIIKALSLNVQSKL